jgi:hypothetical protein
VTRRLALLLPALLLAFALAVPATPRTASAAREFYDNATILLPKVRSDRRDLYRRAVVAAMRRGKLRSVSEATNRSGTKSRRIADKGDGSKSLKKVPLAAVAAIAYTSGRRFWGSELDLLVQLRGGDVVPVTLQYGRNGDVVYSVGERRSGRPRFGGSLPSTGEAIARRYGTGRIRGRGARWKERELAILAGALERLDDRERRVLKGVRFDRSRAGPKGPRNAGNYFWGTAGYRLAVYDRAFKSDRRSFYGSAAAPKPFSAGTIIHEIGHAIAAWPARKALAAGDVARARRLGSGGPVVKAYRRQLGDRRGPTRYGRRSTVESFAESFALYKLDPAGLKRWNPQVYRWFEAEGHLEAAGL